MRRPHQRKWPKGTWMELRSTARLRLEMAEQGMSERRLARYAGCSGGMISHLKSGRRKSVTPALAERIVEALGVDLKQLFEVNTATERSENSNGAAA